jgi:hypothetical protein
MTDRKFITRAKARQRVSEALLSQLSELITCPTSGDIELLRTYGFGPSYQPGTRYLGGEGYDPFVEIEAGEHYPALQRAQRRHRDWEWHSERVDDWINARFAGGRYDRLAFETEFAACFGQCLAAPLEADLSVEGLLASLPDNREPDSVLIHLPAKIPDTDPSNAAASAIHFLWPNGVPSNKKSAEVARSVNIWLSKQPRSLAPVAKVSLETIARLLGRRGKVKQDTATRGPARQLGNSAGK